MGPLTVRYQAVDGDAVAVAYAIGRAVGTAVVRNRIRRRLRACVRELVSAGTMTAGAYLISATAEAATLPYPALRRCLADACGRVVAPGRA